MADEPTEYTGSWNVWNDEGLEYHQQPHPNHLQQDHYRTNVNHMMNTVSPSRMNSDHYIGTIEDNFGGQTYLQQMQNMHHIDLGATKKKIRKDFDYRINEVIEFKKKYGHMNIPHKYHENPSLGTWVDTMRRKYRKFLKMRKDGSMLNSKNVKSFIILEEEIEKLTSIGFELEPRSGRDSVWENRIAQLTRFKEEHGHCNVKEDDTTYPGLGKWVSYLRRSLRLAKTGRRAIGNRLSEEKITLLKEMGFVFELKEEILIKRYIDGFNDLKEFYAKHGNCNVPKFYDVSPTMGLCIEDMRKEYRRICNNIAKGGEASSACMSAEMVYELAAMDFLSDEGCSPFTTLTSETDDGKISSLPIETLDEIIHTQPI